MTFLAEWFRRIWYLLNRRRLQHDLQREMEAHREMMSDAQAFGNMLRLREESQDVWGWNRLDDALRDLRFAGRTLRQSPGFAIGACLVLALGIGLNLTLFQIYNVTVLQPLAVRDIQTLVKFQRLSNRGRTTSVPYAATQFVRHNNTVLSAVLTAARQRSVVWNDFEDRLTAQFVSANWFDELGYNAVAGRLFHESTDERADAQPVVIVTESFWTNRLNRDPNIVGSSVRINNRQAIVAGILPRDYRGVSRDESQLFMPITQMDYFFPGTTFRTAFDSYSNVEMYGRMKAGVPMAAVREGLRLAMDELALAQPEHFKKGEWLEPYSATTRFESPSDRQERLLAVTGIGFLSLLVLTIACANLSNLVLSRAIGRLRELSIRIALGAGRWRVVRLLLAESALLAGIGSLLGLALSFGVVMVLDAIVAPLNATIDWRTILATLGAAAVAMAAIGFLPTWVVSRRDLGTAMKDGGQTASSGLGRTRLRSLMTAVQVAGSCIFLLLAGLMARSVQRVLTPGFDFKNVAVLDVPTLQTRNIDVRSYWAGVRAAIASLAETEDVALVTHAPLGNGLTMWSNLPDAPTLSIIANPVEPQFFGIMRIPIVAGRNFEESDDPDAAVIISRRLAMEAYGSLNIIGQKFPRTPWPNDKKVWTIVGVAADAHSIQLGNPNGAEVYFPLDVVRSKRVQLIARARTDATLLLAAMREAALAIDSHLPVEVRPLTSSFAERLNEATMMSTITLSLATATLLLACIGVFGVISYGASLRRKEISIRLALGAKRHSMIALLVKQSGWPAGAGVLAGFGVALIMSKILESQRVFLGSLDGPILLTAASVILATCGVAALLPSVRALRTDVAQTLRDE